MQHGGLHRSDAPAGADSERDCRICNDVHGRASFKGMEKIYDKRDGSSTQRGGTEEREYCGRKRAGAKGKGSARKRVGTDIGAEAWTNSTGKSIHSRRRRKAGCVVHNDGRREAERTMNWQEAGKIPEVKPKKKGLRIKPQFLGNLLILDVYQDKAKAVRYCMDMDTGEHGYQKEGKRWKRGKLVTALGGDAYADYRYYGSPFDFKDYKFDSENEKKETERFLKVGHGYRSQNYHDAIDWKEMQYDRDKRWEAEKRQEERKENMMKQIPEPPDDIREWIYGKIPHQEYAFYDKQKEKWGCTCCGAEIKGMELKRNEDGKRARHNNKVTCPVCGEPLIAKTRTDSLSEKTGVYLINETNEEASVIRYMDVAITWEYGRHVVEIEENIRVMAYKKGVNKRRKRHTQLYYRHWRTFGKGNAYNRRAKQGYLYPGNFGEALENTVYEDGTGVLGQLAAAGQYLNYNNLLIGIRAIRNYTNVIEYLFKGRFYRLLKETIEETWWWGSYYYGELNIKGTTLEEVFKIHDRQKINRIREHNGGKKMVEWLQYADKYGKKIPQETLEYLIKHEIRPDDFKDKIHELSPQKVQNYLEKQRAAGYKDRTPKEILGQWQDYLSMCRVQEKDMEDEMVYRPKDLKLRHDQMVTNAQKLRIVQEMGRNKELRAEEAAKMREKYPEAEKNLAAIRERYEYQNEEYMILVPKDLVEIIEEGQALHHCAGATERYFDRIEVRETYICFLRRAEEPNIPFYTIEVEPSGTIRQHRSYLDEEPGIEQIRGFLKEWQKVLKNRLTEEDKRLARVSMRKREENIAELEASRNIRVLKGLAEDFMESPLEFGA